MNRLKRLFYIVLANAVISAATVFVVITLVDKNRPGPDPQVTVVMMVNPTMNAAVEAGTPLAVLLSETPAPEQSQVVATPLPPQPTEIVEYRVKSGDTLSKIAMSFDIGIDDIMRLNGLTDPDLISVGDTLYIPTGPLPTYTPVPPTPVTPTLTSRPLTPTISPTPTASPAGNPARPIIEIVIAPGELESERVKISRTGLGELSLAGWQLDDGSGHRYLFPQLNLFEGGSVFLHTTKGLDSATDLYWGLSQPAWQSGETLILRDEKGQERARYEVP